MAIRAGVNLKVTMASVAATVFLGVKSGSMTALGVAMVVAFATAILWPVPARTPSIHWRRISITVGAMLSILVCLLFWSEVLMAQVQRETTLTGRTDLWRLLWFEYRGQLLVGSGFSSFWSDLEGTARQVSAALDWAPPHAHNGYLDLMLDLGLGGLIIMLSYLFLSLRASVDSQAVLVFHLYLVFFLAYNFTESAMLRQNNIFFVVMIVLSEQMRLLRVPVPDSAGRTGTTA
jgi:O-antigen ligase